MILKSIPLEKKFFALADRYADSGDKDVRNHLATALLDAFSNDFFTFLDQEGVEPTNNSAERALRCAVQWRKISLRSRSAPGESRGRKIADCGADLPQCGTESSAGVI